MPQNPIVIPTINTPVPLRPAVVPYDEQSLLTLFVPDGRGGHSPFKAKLFDVVGPSGTTSLIFAQTNRITVASSNSETNISSTGVGSLVLPANFLKVGSSLKFAAFGFHSASGNPTMRMRVYLGTTVVLDTGANASGNSSNALWDMRANVTCVTVGQTGTVEAQGFYTESAGGVNLFGMVNTAPVTLDTTISQTIRVTAQWGTPSSGNTLTLTNLLIDAALPVAAVA